MGSTNSIEDFFIFGFKKMLFFSSTSPVSISDFIAIKRLFPLKFKYQKQKCLWKSSLEKLRFYIVRLNVLKWAKHTFPRGRNIKKAKVFYHNSNWPIKFEDAYEFILFITYLEFKDFSSFYVFLHSLWLRMRIIKVLWFKC